MDLKELETMIIEEHASAFGRTSVEALVIQRDADIKRLAKEKVVRRTADAIRERLQAMLVLSIELMGEHCEEQKWRAGVEGAILAGRASILREILDWMDRVLCLECGSEIGDGARFCSQCGTASN